MLSAAVSIGVASGLLVKASFGAVGFLSAFVVFLFSAGAGLIAIRTHLFHRFSLKTAAISLSLAVASPSLGFGLGLSVEAVLTSIQARETLIPRVAEREAARAMQNTTATDYLLSGESSASTSYLGAEFKTTMYRVPDAPGKLFGNKAAGAIFVKGEVGYLAQGDGSLLRFDGAAEPDSPLRLVSVPSNIQSFLPTETGAPNSLSVRGVAVGLDRIWIAFSDRFVNRQDEPCFGTSVLWAELPEVSNLEPLEFSYFHRAKSCSVGDANSPFQTGGGLLLVEEASFASKKNLLVVATGGNINDPRDAQDPLSGFGSIFAIEIPPVVHNLSAESRAPDAVTLAIGLRNPQSIVAIGNKLCVTEQGPQGGDELNCFTPDLGRIANFGWPISSYGENYGGEVIPHAPTLPSHSEYGFIEPVYFWPDSSVAPATIVESPWGVKSEVVVGTLGSSLEKGANALNFFRPVVYGGIARYELHDRLTVGERVRSIAPHSNGQALWVLDDNGSLWNVSKQ